MLQKSYQYVLDGVASEDDINRWLVMGREALVQAQRLSQAEPASTNLTVAERKKLQASIALIKTIINFLCEPHVGAGLETSDNGPSVFWDDIQSAFANRIRIGIITTEFVAKVHEVLEEPEPKAKVAIYTRYGLSKFFHP